jgi:hypothetical protein
MRTAPAAGCTSWDRRSVIACLAMFAGHGQRVVDRRRVPGGYGFAWVGHFFFEHNQPATFRHPLYSLVGDWVMYGQVITGRIPF